MIIAIDFDGTLVEHKYPLIGPDVPLAFDTLKRLMNCGHKLILYTMRSGKELDDAVKHCEKRGVKFWGINNNPTQLECFTASPKVYAHMYIDDAALGCPLTTQVPVGRQSVNWSEVVDRLCENATLFFT